MTFDSYGGYGDTSYGNSYDNLYYDGSTFDWGLGGGYDSGFDWLLGDCGLGSGSSSLNFDFTQGTLVANAVVVNAPPSTPWWAPAANFGKFVLKNARYAPGAALFYELLYPQPFADATLDFPRLTKPTPVGGGFQLGSVGGKNIETFPGSQPNLGNSILSFPLGQPKPGTIFTNPGSQDGIKLPPFLTIDLTSGGKRKIGNLESLKEQTVAEVIRARGGGGSQVNEVSTDYQQITLGEAANLAAQGDKAAETAIKIAKQASKKNQKYGGK